MQKTRKVLALLLSVIMCASLFVPVVSADDFPDVSSGHKYYNAINYLAQMGIINGFEDGTFKPEESVTRAQYAKIVAYALGNGDILATKQIFTDVPTSHWAAGNIEAMVAQGIINGMGDGTFAPENPVLYEQAVKMTVCALGYDAIAKKNGGYPSGYLMVAQNLGFIKGISDGVVGQAANRGMIAQLIDNMLGINRVDPITGEVNEGSSIKDETLGSESVKGQVVATYKSGLTPELSDACKKNEIIIRKNDEDIAYAIDELSQSMQDNIANYLGKLVSVTYKESSDISGYTVTSLSEQKGKNDIFTLDADDIYDYDDSEIEYYDEKSGDFETVLIENEHFVIYNGKAVDKSELPTILSNLDTGKIKFMSSGGGKKYDVLFITSYETIMAGGLPTTLSTDDDYIVVYEKDNTANKFTLPKESSSKVSVTYKLNGSAAKYTSITQDSVLSIAQSSDDAKSVTEVLISTEKKTSATITSINEDEKLISLDGKEYKMTDSFLTYITNNAGIATVNNKGEFYLDAFGKVAYMKTTIGSTTYGYLTDYIEGSSRNNEPLSLKIYAAGSGSAITASTYGFKETFYINNVKYRTSDDSDINEVVDLLTATAEAFVDGGYIKGTDGTVETTNHSISQPVEFTLNGVTESGNKAIEKLFIYDAENVGKPELVNVALVPGSDANAQSGYKNTSGSMHKLGNYYINSNTKIIMVPEDKEEGTFYARTYASLPEATYMFHAFDADAANIARYVIVYASAQTKAVALSSANTPYIVAEGVREEVSGGDIVEVIKLINGITGDDATYLKGDDTKVYKVKRVDNKYVEDESVSLDLDDLKVGDIVRFVQSDDGTLADVEVVTQRGSGLVPYVRGISASSGDTAVDATDAVYRTFIGTAKLWVDNNLVAVPKFTDDAEFDAAETETLAMSDSVKYYVVDASKSKVADQLLESDKDECSKLDVVDCSLSTDGASKIFVFSQAGIVKFVVVYK